MDPVMVAFGGGGVGARGSVELNTDTGVAPSGDALLLEVSDHILLESGDFILLE